MRGQAVGLLEQLHMLQEELVHANEAAERKSRAAMQSARPPLLQSAIPLVADMWRCGKACSGRCR